MVLDVVCGNARAETLSLGSLVPSAYERLARNNVFSFLAKIVQTVRTVQTIQTSFKLLSKEG